MKKILSTNNAPQAIGPYKCESDPGICGRFDEAGCKDDGLFKRYGGFRKNERSLPAVFRGRKLSGEIRGTGGSTAERGFGGN